MKVSHFVSVSAALLIAAAAICQCPTGSVVLSVSPSSPAAGAPVNVTVTGTAGAGVFLYRGPNLGQTTLAGQGPLNGTVICLASPFNSMSIGMLPQSGTRTVQVPMPSTAGATVNFQAVTVTGGPQSPSHTVDTSNVVTATVGPPPPPPTCNPGTVVLAVTPSNPAAGTPLSVTVTGAAGANVVLFSGPNAGATTLGGPGGGPLAGTVICLNAPFTSQPLGPLPASGTRTIQIPTPANAPAGTVRVFQAVTIAGGATTPTVDTSNTQTVTFAAAPPPPPCTPGTVQLTITPDGVVTPGSTITTSVTGTAGGHVILVESRNLGSLSFPPGSLSLCLGQPLQMHMFGTIPAGGTLTRSHALPPNAMIPTGLTLWFQAVVVTGSGQNTVFDTSNTDSLQF